MLKKNLTLSFILCFCFLVFVGIACNGKTSAESPAESTNEAAMLPTPTPTQKLPVKPKNDESITIAAAGDVMEQIL
jgi:hypothetical protein